MNLDYIRIQNLRSLADTGIIKLRPLTLLVGTNSSGKSTFLRTFPLLRQSVEIPTTGPILWYGRYVDFGTFNQAIRRNASSQEITLEFGLTLEKNFEPNRPTFYYYHSGTMFLEDLKFRVSLSLGQSQKEGKTFTRAIHLDLPTDRISVEANESGDITSLRINEFDGVRESKLLKFVPSENLLPVLTLRPEAAESLPPNAQRGGRYGQWTGPLESVLRESVDPLFTRRVSAERRVEVAHSIGLGSPEVQLAQLRKVAAPGSAFSRRAASLSPSDASFLRIHNAVFAEALPRLLRQIDTNLAAFFRPVRYIAPVRATAERYYRQQDLSVNEVDPQGANLAMFLRSLSWEEENHFSDWCRNQLGFSVCARTTGAHISLFLQDIGSKAEYNIADMGFGFSQILPVLAQVWSMTRLGQRRTSFPPGGPRYYRDDWEPERVGDIVVIEQPELHLHPRLQAKVADMFAAAAVASAEAKRPLTMVFETHSETIVNRIGYLVAMGKLAPSNVQILLFEKQTPESDTQVTQAEFSKEGVLENWPHGFFLAATDEVEQPVQAEFATRP
jgi:hypothetical protein